MCYGGPPGKPGKCSLVRRTDRWSAGHWGRSQVKAWLDLAWLTILPITHLVHDKVALSKDSANVLTSGGLHWAALGGSGWARKTIAAGEDEEKGEPEATAAQENNEADGSGEQKGDDREDDDDRTEKGKEIRRFGLGRNFQIFIDLVILPGSSRGTGVQGCSPGTGVPFSHDIVIVPFHINMFYKRIKSKRTLNKKKGPAVLSIQYLIF